MKTSRHEREIKHGEYLAQQGAEDLWGWRTPAGRLREARRAKLIMEGAALGPGMTVLEVGCGSGHFTEQFAASGCKHLWAVELSPALLAMARQRSLPNVTFLERPFESCGDIGPFDAVIGSSVLHHMDMKEAAATIFRLLKPGGVMSFAEPNLLNPQVFLERRFRKFFPYVSPDETAFVLWPLRKLLLETGFTDVRITPFDWLHPATPERFIPMVSATGRALESLWPFKHFSGSLVFTARRPRS